MNKTYIIKNLDCAHCGSKIEEAVGKMDGIDSAVLNFPLKKLIVSGNISGDMLEKINQTARSIEPEVEIIDEKKSEKKSNERTFIVKNLDCAHCGSEIEQAVGKMDGIDSAVLNFPLKKLIVSGNISGDMLEKINQTARSIEPEVEIVAEKKSGERTFIVKNLDCAHCGSEIEEAVGKIDGIDSAVLNFPTKKLIIKGDVSDDMLKKINETASKVEDGVEIVAEDDSVPESEDDEESMKKQFITLGCGVVMYIAAIILGHLSLDIVSLVFFVIAYLILGAGILKSTFNNLRHGKIFDENFLMTVATVGAFALGEYSEAVGVVLFFRIGEIFEDYAVNKSRKAITAAAGLKVDKVELLRDGEFVTVPSEEVEVGDIVRLKAGERLAVDGVVETGETRIDTSAVNGEPVPVLVKGGDSIMSGCINTTESITVRATATAGESMISKIADAVENASATKPQIDRFITRFSKVYTPFVIAAAVITAIVPSIVTGNWQQWIYTALTFLVISCPCALVLSVPLAYFSGIGAASKLGILFKGGVSLETLASVRAIAFDKTGTITTGTFNVTDLKSYSSMSEDELLSLYSMCETSSTHPVAVSIMQYCGERGIKGKNAERISELSGRGISAEYDGKKVICGNMRLMNEFGVKVPEENIKMGSVVYLAVDGEISGRIIVSDTIKKSSAGAVKELKNMGIKTAMLTGDKKENAYATANELGIDYSAGELMPDGKLEEVKKIREKYGKVMFVGDGINDAPVLAGADVGGAMQSGSDLALEAADAVFMKSDLASVVNAKKISDRTYSISRQNIVFALVIKASVLLLGLFGHPSMWLAVFADSGTAMLLILNSVRVLNTRSIKKWE